MNEIWKPIEGWEDRYEVSNMGHVRSLNYRNTGETKMLQPVTDGKGYLMVGLCRHSSMKWEKIHRLVAAAFVPNPENKPQVNHINGDKTKNEADNLEWATGCENIQHAYKTGLKKGDPKWGHTLGTIHGKEARERQAEKCKRPIIATNIESGEESVFDSAAEIERVLGISHSSIPKVCSGRQKSAKGYTFRYQSVEEE